MPTPATFIQGITGSPSHSNQVGERNRKNPNCKKSKLSLFTDDIILYIDDPGNSLTVQW